MLERANLINKLVALQMLVLLVVARVLLRCFGTFIIEVRDFRIGLLKHDNI